MSKKKDTKIYSSLERVDCPNCGAQASITRRNWVDYQLPLLQQFGLIFIGGIVGFGIGLAMKLV